MNKHRVKCTCGTCDSEGNYYQCKGCLRIWGMATIRTFYCHIDLKLNADKGLKI